MISIIIPVIRPEKVKTCIKAIERNSDGLSYEIVSEIDKDGIGCPKMVKRLTAKAKGDLVMFLGDDTVPEPGFLKAALQAMNDLPGGWGVVGLNTEDRRIGAGGSNPKAHWMAHREMLKHIPGGDFFSTSYHHCYGDDELFDIANELKRWAYAKDSEILHDHYVNGKNTWDAGYQAAYDTHLNSDRKTYYRRKIQRKGLNIGLGIPASGTQTHRLFNTSYRRAVYTYLKLPGVPPIKEYEPDVPIGEFSREIAHNRNDLIRQALNDGVSHLIQLDTDQEYPSDFIIKLARHAAKGKHMVVAPVHRRYEPFELIMLRGAPDTYYNVPEAEKYSGDLVEIDAAGSGCVMFSLLAALEIDDPWFELMPTPKGDQMGEDIAFCSKMRAKGFRIYADTSIEIGHIAEIIINREFHEIWKRLNKNFMNGGHDNGRNDNRRKELQG
jgi:GT2 family glycosyltransferase